MHVPGKTFPLLLLLVAAVAAPLPAQFGYVTTSYHGVTSATHQSQFNTLTAQGYRLISLTVSGGRANARYSAVWQQASGPNWVSAHDMTPTQYGTQSATWRNLGYRPKLLSASGADNDRVFAAMWVADGVDAVQYVEDFDNYPTYFNTYIADQRAAGRRLVALCATQALGAPMYSYVFEPDDSGIAWGAVIDDTGAEFNDKHAEFALGHARPTLISTSEAQRYAHLWRDDRIGNWVAVTGRTSSQFAADKTLYAGQGLTLASIAASGSGVNARFGGIFQERLTPYARSHSRTGTAVASMAGFDTYMESLMESRMVRNASIAVTKNGRLVYARGYTWAEPGQFVTQPTTPWRIGSISKAVTGTLVHDLISRGTGGIDLDTGLVNYLGISTPVTQASDADVRRLLRHTSGMMGNPDPFDALAFASPTLVVLPVDERYIVRYACNQSFTTLDRWSYSNAGATALGQIVEQATGQAYMTALRDRLFAPVGTTALYQQMARPDDFAPGEVTYHMPELFLLPSDLHLDRRLQSAQYARDYWDSGGGVVCSAIVLARVVSGAFCIGDDSPSLLPAARAAAQVRSSLAKLGGGTKRWADGSWGWTSLGGGRYLFEHDGATDGFGTRCVFTTDGLCIAAFTNMSFVLPDADQLVAIADQVNNWPNNDLFPTYGMPTFARTPQLTNAITDTVANVSDTALIFDGDGLDQVTSIRFGAATITSQSQNTWADGWFVKVSPTRIHVHPPQGWWPGTYPMRAISALGQGNEVDVTLIRSLVYAVKAPDTVQNGQPFGAIVSRGLHPNLSFAILTLSPDLSPSVAPGIVDLGIGSMFATLAVSDVRQFNGPAGALRWDLPTIAGMPQVHFQAALLDPFEPSPWPLPATAVETVVRVP